MESLHTRLHTKLMENLVKKGTQPSTPMKPFLVTLPVEFSEIPQARIPAIYHVQGSGTDEEQHMCSKLVIFSFCHVTQLH